MCFCWLKDGEGELNYEECSCCLGAKRGPQLTASQEMGTSDPQPHKKILPVTQESGFFSGPPDESPASQLLGFRPLGP